ncbi:MAG: hypothetical protein UH542_05965 [Bacteroidales bacterium]|nr:hypothetical protein [Bacteroidales bacterium]
MSTKTENINEIINQARSVSKEKNVKKRERKLNAARINFLKAKEEEVQAVLDEINRVGAEAYFNRKADEYAKKGDVKVNNSKEENV